MMDTEKLYYKDPYLADFTATVLTCEEGKSGYSVVLDRTAFYPEGGGQPTDKGTLGGVQVLEVHEKDGVITHLCSGALPAGASVVGKIDWERRFDHMQQHSGEHICSGLICARFHCDNVGFHMGAESVTIDFNADIFWGELMEIEAAANRYIYENHPIDIRVYADGVPDCIDYRSKKALTGPVRIVAFPGADCCACCGTHVARSGAVGMVKFLSVQKFREGVRIELLCGERVRRYLSALHIQNGDISRALSAKPMETGAAVTRILGELAAEKERAAAYEEQLWALRAKAYEGRGDVLLIESPMPNDSLRRLAVAIGEVCGGLCAVFAGEDGRYAYAVKLPPDEDERAFAKAMNGMLQGRGGGRDGFIQGSAECTAEEIRAFFS